jgi:hypothetical protein
MLKDPAPWVMLGTDQNSDFIFTIDDESKGLDMKGGSEKIVSIGGWGTLDSSNR